MNRSALQVPVLTYHSMNTVGNQYHNNDHVALYHDLRTIHALGKKIVPLKWLVECLGEKSDCRSLSDAVALSFDDGPNHDFIDWTHHVNGPQKSFFTIMREFQREFGRNAQPDLHATAFVVASPDARQELDRTCMRGKGWWEDSWWAEAEQTSLFSIQSHSWDHLHPTLKTVAQKDQLKGDFSVVDCYEDCREQIEKAADYIAGITGHRPDMFAYPWGQSSQYCREVYFPEYTSQHGTVAAFSVDPRPVTPGESIWNLPRFVCGADWRSTDELKHILQPEPC